MKTEKQIQKVYFFFMQIAGDIFFNLYTKDKQVNQILLLAKKI